jgi:hypothetical protein
MFMTLSNTHTHKKNNNFFDMEKEDDQQSGNRKLQPPTISQHTKTLFNTSVLKPKLPSPSDTATHCHCSSSYKSMVPG